MRLSLRRVVKFTIFLILFMILNVWVSYNVNLWSFNNFQDRGKVSLTSASRGRAVLGDNGRAFPHPDKVDTLVLGASNVQRHLSDINSSSQERRIRSLGRSKDYFEEKNVFEQPIKSGSFDSKSRPQTIILKDRNRRSNAGVKTKTAIATSLRDIFMSVKTTSNYHNTRIRLIEKTWFGLARQETYFFTDGDDKELSRDLDGHLINTNCTTDHSRRALSCKMAVEIDYYMASRKRWFCHFDDDVYVNVPRLVNLLQKYNHKEDWYLGKPSLKHPLEVVDRDNPGMKLAFWFATGGAGFCISRSLALKMSPYAGGGRFMTTAEQIRLPDDCTIGYIIEHLLKKRLTIIDLFHSHLEALWLIKRHQLDKQITFSYSKYSGKRNVLNVNGFADEDDPTRLRSLHCRLYPTFKECQGLPPPED